jgi:hypothetical protein
MDDAAIRQDIHDYRIRLREHKPNASRLALIDSLVETLHHAELETSLKVELRKSLLLIASWLRYPEPIAEPLLDRELVAYRKRVAEQISEDARLYFLFMFKHTSNEELNQLISHFSQPDFQRMMQTSHQALMRSFVSARQNMIRGLAR